MISLSVLFISLIMGICIGMLGVWLLHIITAGIERKEHFNYVKAILLCFGRFLLYAIGLAISVLWLHLNLVIMLAGIVLTDIVYVIISDRKSRRKGAERDARCL